MSRPIEQALTNLIPRHPSALPPELIELAQSLLAQSRSKCSTLKKEEEIARTYACANLACERLKTTLNLPPIEPRPPIPPRVYNKLYTYFSSTLTHKRPKPKPQASTPGKPLPQRSTPSKPQSLKPFHVSRAPKTSLKHKTNPEKESAIPKWLAPVTRLLCHELSTQKAIPHVLAGVETILNLPDEESGVRERKITALVAAVWFFVVFKMRGKEGAWVENLERKKRVKEVVNGARENEWVRERVGADFNGEEWRGWEEFEERDVGVWRRAIVEGGWRDWEWFLGVENGVGVEGDVPDEDEDREGDGSEGGEVGGEERVLKKRRGMGDRYDYLSEENQAEYKEWEAMMLKEIDRLEAEGALVDDGMDLDAEDD